MRDVDNADALLSQAPQDFEKHAAFLVAERGGRLVQHDKPRPAGQRLDDFDNLAISQLQRSHRTPYVHADAELLALRARLFDRCAEGGQSAAVWPASKQDIFGDGQVWHVRQLLWDERDALLQSIARRRETDCLAIQ